MYRSYLGYNKSFYGHFTDGFVTQKLLNNLFGVLYFYLTVKKNDTRGSMVSLTFKYNLDQALHAKGRYSVIVLILKEENISMKTKSGEAFLYMSSYLLLWKHSAQHLVL